MGTATVTVQYVNLPKEGKKQGSIKGADGTSYGVWANHIGNYKQGATYSIEYEERDYNGKTYRTVKDATLQAPAASHAGNGGANGPDKDKLIFVTGVVGRAMGSGSFQATDVKVLTLAALEAWSALSAKPHAEGEAPF